MTRSKGETDSAEKRSSECCMCGDYGLSDELFQCSICSFRSQHRYCSNLYPKAESYTVCNWCLIRPDRPTPDPKSAQASLSSSSPASQKNDVEEEEDAGKKKSRSRRSDDRDLVVRINGPDLKKQSKTPSPPSVAVRKRIITRGALEERLRRTRSEEINNNNNNKASNNNTNNNNNQNNKGIITKQVFRNKVRRYKLLDEVSS